MWCVCVCVVCVVCGVCVCVWGGGGARLDYQRGKGDIENLGNLSGCVRSNIERASDPR